MGKNKRKANKDTRGPLVRWEYRPIHQKLGEPGFEFRDLQKLGNEGWEVCTALGSFWMFKRLLRRNAKPEYVQALN